jgi:hypothetical protein
VGHAALVRTAKAHAARAALLAWAALAAVIAGILAVPHGWFGTLVPVPVVAIAPTAVVLAALVVALLPLERVGSAIVGDLCTGDDADGRLRNIADELSIALGETAGTVLVSRVDIPNAGAFPTNDGVVVMATSRAVDQLSRDELEALVAAQFAGMRAPWCRLVTRAELVWKSTIGLAFASVFLAMPVPLMIGAVMVFLPKSVEAARDLCADVAAVDTTRNPAALADAMRHLAPVADAGSDQRLTHRWYMPVSPFLVVPKRSRGTRSQTVMGKQRSWTTDEEVAAELELRADRAEALADGADPRAYTGREYRRRFGRLGIGP